MIFLCVRKNAIAERDLSTKRTFGDLKVMFCGTSRKGIHLNFRSELYGNSLLLLCNWLIWVSIYTDREHAMTTRVAQVCFPSHWGHRPSTLLPEIGWNGVSPTVLGCHIDVPYHLTDLNKLNYISFALLILKQISSSTFKNNMNAQLAELIF